jgi:hypothetical protein
MSSIWKVALIINCGYARVCIYENSNPGARGQLARREIDRQQRRDSFRAIHPEYEFPDKYFNLDGKGMAQFDRDSNKILDSFKKFRSDIAVNKQSYLTSSVSRSGRSYLVRKRRSIHWVTAKDVLNCTQSTKHLSHLSPNTTLNQW